MLRNNSDFFLRVKKAKSIGRETKLIPRGAYESNAVIIKNIAGLRWKAKLQILQDSGLKKVTFTFSN